MGAKEIIMHTVRGIVNFMKNNTEPFFRATFLTVAIGYAVVETISTTLPRGGDD